MSTAVRKRKSIDEDSSRASSPSRADDETNRILSTHTVYFTKITHLTDTFNAEARSLGDILNEIKPVRSVHFNHVVEISWLMDQYPPDCRTNPVCIVLGETRLRAQGLPEEPLPCLSEWSNVKMAYAPLPIHDGTHHSKLSMFEDATGQIHIIISTANLHKLGWENQTQQFYYILGERVGTDQNSQPSTSDGTGKKKLRLGSFKTQPIIADLMHYLGRYEGESVTEIKHWVQLLRTSAFAETPNRLIFSVPGRHADDESSKVGHMAVRSILSSLNCPHPSKNAYYRSSKDSASNHVLIMQTSCISDLGNHPEAWFESEFSTSLNGGKGITKPPLLIYPSKSSVQKAALGSSIGAAGLVYWERTAMGQTWLRDNMCEWNSETWCRTGYMPHVKTYAAMDTDTGEIDWQILTSANLSRAAWGKMEKNGQQIMNPPKTRSYELGVLILDKDKMLIPFDLPPVKYRDSDTPWLCEYKFRND